MDSAFAAQLRRNTDSEIVFFSLDTLGVPQVAIATLPRETVAEEIRRAPIGKGEDTAFSRFQLEAGGERYAAAPRGCSAARTAYRSAGSSDCIPGTASWPPTGS